MRRHYPKRRYRVKIQDNNGKEYAVKIKAITSFHAAALVERRLGKKNITVVDVEVDNATGKGV